LGTIALSILRVIGLLTVAIVAGVAGAVAAVGTIPGIANACTHGVVCYIVKADWFPFTPGGTKPANATCLAPEDAQRIYRLGQVLVIDTDAARLDFGENKCISLTTVVDKVCSKLGGKVADVSQCAKLKADGR
jgi:hypothetical protein